MNINISINSDIYHDALEYAQEHHTSIKNIIESYLVKLRPIKSTASNQADIKLQELINLTKGLKLDADDINGDEAKQSYLEEKYVR